MNDRYIPSSDSVPPRGQGNGIQLPMGQRTLTTDLSGDFSLPDYQPEIKRLLRIIASPSPPERYVSGGNMDLDGALDYFVLYMGNDAKLYCAPLSSDYGFSVALNNIVHFHFSFSFKIIFIN